MGSAFISVSYFQNFPVYYLIFLENKGEDLILFTSPDGRWQQDGSGVTLQSEVIGKIIEEYALK